MIYFDISKPILMYILNHFFPVFYYFSIFPIFIDSFLMILEMLISN